MTRFQPPHQLTLEWICKIDCLDNGRSDNGGSTILTNPSRYMPPPTTSAEIAVPIMANNIMVPMFWKKLP